VSLVPSKQWPLVFLTLPDSTRHYHTQRNEQRTEEQPAHQKFSHVVGVQAEPQQYGGEFRHTTAHS
jgi:hypothetical protein